MTNGDVFLDTNFLIKLLNPKDILHDNVKGYFLGFIKRKITLKVSAIAIAEYLVKGCIARCRVLI
jgi:predicted nucleic acid-binding protein